MTIAQLLSANGAQVPRYITVDGRTVFGTVTSTPTGVIHADHGLVTRVPNHTFHGGNDPVDLGDQSWWNDDVKIVRHIVAMKLAFPGFVYVTGDDGPPGWCGAIDTGRGSFTIAVHLRRDEGLPFVAVLSKQRLGVDVNGRFRARRTCTTATPLHRRPVGLGPGRAHGGHCHRVGRTLARGVHRVAHHQEVARGRGPRCGVDDQGSGRRRLPSRLQRPSTRSRRRRLPGHGPGSELGTLRRH